MCRLLKIPRSLVYYKSKKNKEKETEIIMSPVEYRLCKMSNNYNNGNKIAIDISEVKTAISE